MSSNHTLLHPDDDVFIALKNIPAGEEIAEGVRAAAEIAAGHKIARRAVKAGYPVHRYNQIIGNASADIAVGDHGDASGFRVGVDRDVVDFVSSARELTIE